MVMIAGQRPSSKPRRIEPATVDNTANNVANRNNQTANRNNQSANPPTTANQPKRSIQIFSSPDVARSSTQGEVQTRPIEVICGPAGEASVRCEGTLSEVGYIPLGIDLVFVFTGGRAADSKSACQRASRKLNIQTTCHLSRGEQVVSGDAPCAGDQGSTTAPKDPPPSGFPKDPPPSGFPKDSPSSSNLSRRSSPRHHIRAVQGASWFPRTCSWPT